MDFAELCYGHTVAAKSERSGHDPRPKDLQDVSRAAEQKKLARVFRNCSKVRSALLDTLPAAEETPTNQAVPTPAAT